MFQCLSSLFLFGTFITLCVQKQYRNQNKRDESYLLFVQNNIAVAVAGSLVTAKWKIHQCLIYSKRMCAPKTQNKIKSIPAREKSKWKKNLGGKWFSCHLKHTLFFMKCLPNETAIQLSSYHHCAIGIWINGCVPASLKVLIKW